jgi:hypothetical protein
MVIILDIIGGVPGNRNQAVDDFIDHDLPTNFCFE